MPSSALSDLQSAALSEPQPAIAIEDVSRDFSRMIERAEVNAWLDLYRAAPADFAAEQGLAFAEQDNLVWTTCTTIPFIHFNCAKNLGVDSAATESQLDALLAHYRAAGILRPWFYANPHTEPSALRCWLEARACSARAAGNVSFAMPHRWRRATVPDRRYFGRAGDAGNG